MTKTDCEVGIIGAGVAGLTAASVLTNAGVSTVCLEAAPRIGGRILTVHDRLCPLPIELGAEFVHGQPSELLDLIKQHNLTLFEHSTRAIHLIDGRAVKKKRWGQRQSA